MATHNNHPLPPSPGQLPSQQRPAPGRKPRTLSFRSDKSHKSQASKDKIDLVETSAEKEAKRLHSKADPTLAMNEAEPAMVAATAKHALGSIRNMQHKDAFGNIISEPDRSNPTRNRWERPLDTIRSFEAAIDGENHRKGQERASLYRSDTDSVADWNRPRSYYNNFNGLARFPQDSYYGPSRPTSMLRPDSTHFEGRQGGMAPRDSYYEPHSQNGGRYGGNTGYGPPQNGARRGYPRMASEPQFTNGRRSDHNLYPLPNEGRSYETVGTGSGSGSLGEPAGYQTDPTSSDNSSVDRMNSPPRQPANDYGIGFSPSPSYQPAAFNLGGWVGGGHSTHQAAYESPPAFPQKRGSILRKQTAVQKVQAEQRPAPAEKRKSWLSRRFSKH